MEDNGSRRSVHKGKDIHRSASSRNFRRPLNVPQLDQSCCDSEAAATSPSISERCGLRSTAILLLMLVARSACASGLRTACRTGQSFGRKNPLCRARNATARAMSSNLHYPQPIKIDARGQHTATVIMLHGLGDSGDGWAGIGSQFAPELPHCRFLFPTAPERRITLNMGMRMNGWYDITDLSADHKEDVDGLKESTRYVESLIEKEATSGVAASRIVVAGFSQGGAIALLSLRSATKLAGVIGLSTYLPLRAEQPVLSDANKQTPVLMCHGSADMVVAYPWGKASFEALKAAGADATFKTYPGMGHSACDEELAELVAFLKRVLPANAQ